MMGGHRHAWVLFVPLLLGLAVTTRSVQAAPTRPAPRRATTPGTHQSVAGFDSTLFDGLRWRCIGPWRGGRVAAVTGVPGQPLVYYFGGTGGGVWKTRDGGASWSCVSDSAFGGSVGAVAVSEWDPNVVYAGGGEVTVRGNVSHGYGVFRSTDAGRTWQPRGLADSRCIPRIRIHPRNPDLVYAAVLGHLYGPHGTRGIYRSRDGGGSWERVLYVDENTGAVELAMDPTNPRVLYASFWRVRRTPYSLESGGPGSSLWKSQDGGDSWQEITRSEGLPRGTIGISAVSVSASNPDNLYAIIEAEDGGVFRSRDGGRSWLRVNEERKLRQRAWYYTRIYADPADEDVVYVVNVQFWRSKDGGKTFTTIDAPHGDNHDLWIAPEDPRRMINGNDGGACVTFDGGRTWSTLGNQPTAQFYRVATDDAFPYRIYGAQQDNSTVRIASRSFGGGIGVRDWEESAGGESGWLAPHPRDPDVVFGGSYGGYLVRYDHGTKELRAVNVWPDNPMGWGAADLKYRFQWNFPIFFSPHEPATLYAAGNVLFRTRNEGQSWEAISPDLTRNDHRKMQPSGGPITKDNTSVEYYGTIFTAMESPYEPGVLWTGSDDGLVQLSRDCGATWKNVTPRDMPAWIMVNSLEANPFQKGGLYVAATMYKSDDFRPYLYRTTDYGEHWTRIGGGIPAAHFTRVLRADPRRPGLLYCGTESGVYVSFDDGEHWQSLQLNLPVVPITDLAVKNDDLIAATQGRSFWVLDDLTPLHQLNGEIAPRRAHLFAPRPTPRLTVFDFGAPPNVGPNPPNGVVVHYWFARDMRQQRFALEFRQEDGTLIRRFEHVPEEKPAVAPAGAGVPPPSPAGAAAARPAERPAAFADPAVVPDAKLPARAGMHRFVWDMRYGPARGFEGLVLWDGWSDGPVAVPGRYRVRLCAPADTLAAGLEILRDPRIAATEGDMRAQFDFLMAVRDQLTRTHDAIAAMRDVRGQLDQLRRRVGESAGVDEAGFRRFVAAVDSFDARMTRIEQELYQTRNQSEQDPLNFPIRLNNRLSALASTVALSQDRPTEQAETVRRELSAAIDTQLRRWEDQRTHELPELDELIRQLGVPAVSVKQPPAPAGAGGR